MSSETLSSEREVREPKAATEFTSHTYFSGPGNAMIADWNAESAITQGYYANVFVWACVRALAEDVAALIFRAGRDVQKPEEFDLTSPLARLLGAPPYGPNKYTTGRQLLAWSVAQLLVTGRFGWELAYPTGRGKKQPESLWPLAATHLEPIVSDKPGQYFDHFVYNRATGREVKLREDQVLYYWRPSQNDWRQPESALQAARLDISVAVMQDRYDYAFLRNDARPATIVVHEKFSEPGAKQAFRAQFVADHGGPDNAGRTAFVETSEDGATPKESLLVQTIGLSQKDAMFIERYDRKIRSIIVAFGVPISRLGDSSEKTFSNASVEYEVYLRDRVKPLAGEIQDAINLQLSPRLGNEMGWFDLGPIKSAIQGARVQSAGIPELIKTRVIKINEARHALDLDPVEDGDRFLTDLELGLLQNGAATLVVPQTSASAAPYERGQEETEVPDVPSPAPAEPEAGKPEPQDATTPPTPVTPPVAGKRNTSRTARETRRLRAYAAMERRVQSFETRFEAAFQQVLDDQLKYALARLTGKRGRQMLRVGAEGRQSDLDSAQIFDQEHWRNATAADVEALFLEISTDSATHVGELLSLDLDLPSEWAAEFVQSRANQLAWNVTDTTYAGIQDALQEGVAAGESIPKLSERIRGLFAQTYKNRARTVARTEVISAYNGAAARVAEVVPDVTSMEWLATPGPRTRASHAAADGQRVPVGGKFQVGSAQLGYPGDPAGTAKEVVNCRCTVLLLTSAED